MCSVVANFTDGDGQAWSYIHLAVAHWKPTGDPEKDATVQRGMGDRIKKELFTNMRLKQVHLAGSGH